MGIEFPDKSNSAHEKGMKNFDSSKDTGRSVLSHPSASNTAPKGPVNTNNNKPIHKSAGVFSGIKKVFSKPNHIPRPVQNNVSKENTGLRDILNKTLSENKVLEVKKEEPKVEEVKKIEPAPISLSALKENKPVQNTPSNDRSASTERMSALKDLIMQNAPEAIKKTPARNAESIASAGGEVEVKQNPTPTPNPVPVPPKVIQNNVPPVQQQTVQNTPPKIETPKVKEVPEDVLLKVLE